MSDLFNSADISAPEPIRIVMDSREDVNGRALFCLSALHLCGPELGRVSVVHALGPTCAVMDVALEAFSWDVGVTVRKFAPHEAATAFDAAYLYLSVSLGSVDEDWLKLSRRSGAKALVVSQFPDLSSKADPILPARFAHDTRRFADLIMQNLDMKS